MKIQFLYFSSFSNLNIRSPSSFLSATISKINRKQPPAFGKQDKHYFKHLPKYKLTSFQASPVFHLPTFSRFWNEVVMGKARHVCYSSKWAMSACIRITRFVSFQRDPVFSRHLQGVLVPQVGDTELWSQKIPNNVFLVLLLLRLISLVILNNIIFQPIFIRLDIYKIVHI